MSIAPSPTPAAPAVPDGFRAVAVLEGLIPGSPIATEAAADYRPSPRPLDVKGMVARDGAHAATDDDGDDLLPGEMPTVGAEVLALANGRASA